MLFRSLPFAESTASRANCWTHLDFDSNDAIGDVSIEQASEASERFFIWQSPADGNRESACRQLNPEIRERECVRDQVMDLRAPPEPIPLQSLDLNPLPQSLLKSYQDERQRHDTHQLDRQTAAAARAGWIRSHSRLLGPDTLCSGLAKEVLRASPWFRPDSRRSQVAWLP